MIRRSMIITAALLLTGAATAAQPPWVKAAEEVVTPLGFRASEINGATLHGARGEALGEIEAVLATRDGVVAGLAVEIADGVLGIGDRVVVLRFDQVHRTGDRVATFLSRAQLAAQPPWDD